MGNLRLNDFSTKDIINIYNKFGYLWKSSCIDHEDVYPDKLSESLESFVDSKVGKTTHYTASKICLYNDQKVNTIIHFIFMIGDKDKFKKKSNVSVFRSDVSVFRLSDQILTDIPNEVFIATPAYEYENNFTRKEATEAVSYFDNLIYSFLYACLGTNYSTPLASTTLLEPFAALFGYKFISYVMAGQCNGEINDILFKGYSDKLITIIKNFLDLYNSTSNNRNSNLTPYTSYSSYAINADEKMLSMDFRNYLTDFFIEKKRK